MTAAVISPQTTEHVIVRASRTSCLPARWSVSQEVNSGRSVPEKDCLASHRRAVCDWPSDYGVGHR